MVILVQLEGEHQGQSIASVTTHQNHHQEPADGARDRPQLRAVVRKYKVEGLAEMVCLDELLAAPIPPNTHNFHLKINQLLNLYYA